MLKCYKCEDFCGKDVDIHLHLFNFCLFIPEVLFWDFFSLCQKNLGNNVFIENSCTLRTSFGASVGFCCTKILVMKHLFVHLYIYDSIFCCSSYGERTKIM